MTGIQTFQGAVQANAAKATNYGCQILLSSYIMHFNIRLDLTLKNPCIHRKKIRVFVYRSAHSYIKHMSNDKINLSNKFCY